MRELAEVVGGEPAECPWVTMATAHPWGLLWLPAAASAAWQPASTGYLGGKAQPGVGGGWPYTMGGVVVFAYVPMHVPTPETWPVEAPVKVSDHSPTGLGDTAHILRSFVGAG